MENGSNVCGIFLDLLQFWIYEALLVFDAKLS